MNEQRFPGRVELMVLVFNLQGQERPTSIFSLQCQCNIHVKREGYESYKNDHQTEDA